MSQKIDFVSEKPIAENNVHVPTTEVVSQNDDDGSWEGVISYYDERTGKMVPRVRVKVRSISRLLGKKPAL